MRSKYLTEEDIDTLDLLKKEQTYYDDDLENGFKFNAYWFDLHCYIRLTHKSIYNDILKRWTLPWVSIYNINVCGFPGTTRYYGQCKNLKELKFLIKRINGEHSYKLLKKDKKWE